MGRTGTKRPFKKLVGPLLGDPNPLETIRVELSSLEAGADYNISDRTLGEYYELLCREATCGRKSERS